VGAEGAFRPAQPDQSSPLHRERRIARLAGRQHGLLSLHQLLALGLSGSAVHDRVKAGRLHQLYRGVYALGHRSLTRDGRLLAAVLACGPDALLSHRSALVLWGVCSQRPGPIHVTSPTARGRNDRRITAHRSRSMPHADTTRRHGIPTTTVCRALLDLAADPSCRDRELESALDEATFLRLLDPGALALRLERLPPRRGVGRLRGLLTADRPPARTRSGLEDRFLELVAAAQLPRPFTNHRIRTPEGSFEVDFYWPAAGLVVETDGRRAHDSGRRFHADRDRDQRLGLAGLRVFRFSPQHVFDQPQQTIRRLAALLRARPAER
jgi:very-short-patch-repair endonuclease